MVKHLNVAVAALAAIVLALCAGCGGDDSSASGGAASASALASDPELGGADLIAKAEKEGHLTLYTANTLEQAQRMADAFHDAFPKIDVELQRQAGSTLYEVVRSELHAGKLRADVIEESDLGLSESLPKDLFVKRESPSDAQYPKQWPAAGAFYPVYEDPHGFAYNTALVDDADAPKSWEDYLNPAFNGQRAHVAPSAGGCSWVLGLYEGKVLGEQQLGNHEAYWKKVAATDPSISPSNGEMIQRLSQGELKISTMLLSAAALPISQGAPVKFVFPTEGLPACDIVTGVVAKAPHPNAARLYQNWSLSQRGQTTWTGFGGYSVRKDVKPPKGTPPNLEIWQTPLDEYLDEDLKSKWEGEWNKLFHYTP